MKPYQWILFDADETLFHFDAYSGLRDMMRAYGVDFSADDYAAYNELNRPLWVDYQDGRISAQQLQQRRFNAWAERLQVSAARLNSEFLAAMADICRPLDGAVDLLEMLRGRVRLGLITNGFTELQRARLQRTGLHDHFEVLVISEEVGYAKPHRGIFDHAHGLMGKPDAGCVMMVGDKLETDILGGINAGFDTCWFNPAGLAAADGIAPHYQVRTLAELKERLQTVLSA